MGKLVSYFENLFFGLSILSMPVALWVFVVAFTDSENPIECIVGLTTSIAITVIPYCWVRIFKMM